MHAFGALHDIPPKLESVARAGRGTDSIVHRLPFQRSTNASWADRVKRYPTAMHEARELHETLWKVEDVDRAGRGANSIVHRRPFQRSANASDVLV